MFESGGKMEDKDVPQALWAIGVNMEADEKAMLIRSIYQLKPDSTITYEGNTDFNPT